VAGVLSYAITGWLTGVVAALRFNALAKLTGGIDAKYFSTIIKENTPNPALYAGLYAAPKNLSH
jgi:hypothetical protein